MMLEKKFSRNMKKAGWYTFKDGETGRVVTNAYRHEVDKISKISGVECELVPHSTNLALCKIGPVLHMDSVKIPAGHR